MIAQTVDTLRRHRRTLLGDMAGVVTLALMTLGLLNLPGLI